MAFPPAFTNVWDTTFPPDTQLANLLGQDLRNLRVDVMQRMSLLSGTLANRPTPEIVNATWGGAGFGLLFFATDTNQIFQWSGAAWTDVSSSFTRSQLLNSQANLAPVVGNNTDQTVFTYNLPANTVANLQGIRISIVTHKSAGAAAGTYKYSLNGQQFANFGYGGDLSEIVTLLNIGAAAAAFSKCSFNQNNLNNNGTIGAGLNWAGAQTLLVTYNVAPTDTINPFMWTVELLR
jgi:hypothetical protein